MVIAWIHIMLAAIYRWLENHFKWLDNPEYVVRFQNFFGVRMTPVEVNYVDNTRDQNVANHNRTRYILDIDYKWANYLFRFGTALGGEMAFTVFFTFWYWNVNRPVTCRVVLVWGVCMYFGQALKDTLRWPRPNSSRVAKLDTQWGLEYGMPSTHAIVGSSVPFSIVYFTDSIYQNYFGIGTMTAVAICTLVCMSRVYLGMHSFFDLLGGLLIFAIFFPIVIFIINNFESAFFACEWGWFWTLLIGIPLCLSYPTQDRWTQTRGDTFGLVGSFIGLLIGEWLNHQRSSGICNEVGVFEATYNPQCEPVPFVDLVILAVIREVVGIALLLLTKKIAKKLGTVVAVYLTRAIPSYMLVESGGIMMPNVGTELFTMFFTYTMVALSVCFASPLLFQEIGFQKDKIPTGLIQVLNLLFTHA